MERTAGGPLSTPGTVSFPACCTICRSGKGSASSAEAAPPRYIFGDWQLNAITTVQTGLPFTIFSGVDTANSGVGSVIHPDAVQGVDPKPSNQSADKWFNTAAFANAPDCRNQAVFNTLSNPLVCFGNLGRNTFSAPGLVNIDFSLLKVFRLGERAQLQFRTEFFNSLNTPPLAFPSSTLTSSTVGAF